MALAHLKTLLIQEINADPMFTQASPEVRAHTTTNIMALDESATELAWDYYYKKKAVAHSWAEMRAWYNQTHPLIDPRVPRGPLEDIVQANTPVTRTPDGRRIETGGEVLAREVDRGLPNFKLPDPIELPDVKTLLLLGGAVLLGVAVIYKKL